MPQRQVLENEIAAGADRSEECCDKQTEVEHRRASRGSPILCYLRTELHLSGFAVPREALLVDEGWRVPEPAVAEVFVAGASPDDRRDDAGGPQQTLFSWTEFMAEEPTEPKRRRRKAEPASLSLFEWALEREREAEPAGAGR